jgi:hypothetical protein
MSENICTKMYDIKQEIITHFESDLIEEFKAICAIECENGEVLVSSDTPPKSACEEIYQHICQEYSSIDSCIVGVHDCLAHDAE